MRIMKMKVANFPYISNQQDKWGLVTVEPRNYRLNEKNHI